MHEMYGHWEDGEYNPLNNDIDVDRSCVNCGRYVDTPKPRLFCSDLCQDEASVVRYARRRLADGRANQDDIKDILKIRTAHLLAGGYHWRKREIPEAIRQEVSSRAGGLCQRCGEPGNELDHIDGDSNEPDNLQLLCHACHKAKTFSRIVRLTPDDPHYVVVRAKRREIQERIGAPVPLRECDDPDSWDAVQKELLRERREFWD